MSYKAEDWILHATFGIGKVLEVDGGKLTIRFLQSGERKVMDSPQVQPTAKPSNEPVLPKAKRSADKPLNTSSVPKYTFQQLIDNFNSNYPGGFESHKFADQERKNKHEAAKMLASELSEERFSELLRAAQYSTIAKLAKGVVQKTNLVFSMEKAKFTDALKLPHNQDLFSHALFDLLYGQGNKEQRFAAFVDLLATIGACKWTISTYFQFLFTKGEMMFMKPKYAKAVADSLGMSLNYRTDPNWLTYKSLQDVSKKLESELRSRGLCPESGIDLQSFMFCSVQLADRISGKVE